MARSLLTPRQHRFVDAVRRGRSYTAAALEAGYSESTAHCAGRKIARKPAVRAQLDDLLQRSGVDDPASEPQPHPHRHATASTVPDMVGALFPEPPAPSSTYKLRPKQRAFLDAYALSGNVSKAAELAKVARFTHYDWLEREPEYQLAFAEAEKRFADHIRDAVRRRAIEGIPEPVVWQGQFQRDEATGEMVTTLRRSDRLLEVLAKARCIEFRDKTELTGPGGGPVQFQVITGVPQPQALAEGLEGPDGTEEPDGY